jgi:sugar (pentulose or hexulose) kinase
VTSDDFGFGFRTDDWDPAEWWTWVARTLAEAVGESATRLGAAVVAGGFAVAGSRLLENDSRLAKPTLGASAAAAGVFAGSAALAARRRQGLKPPG